MQKVGPGSLWRWSRRLLGAGPLS